MSKSASASSIVCPYCGAPTGEGDAVVHNPASDPRQVTECASCDRVLDVGGHRW